MSKPISPLVGRITVYLMFAVIIAVFILVPYLSTKYESHFDQPVVDALHAREIVDFVKTTTNELENR